MRKIRKTIRAIAALLLGLTTAVAGLEFGLRFLLFSDSGIGRRLGSSWRKAEWYADPRGEDAYWKLQYFTVETAARLGVPLIGTRPYLLAATGDVATTGARLFEVQNGEYGHYNDLGNWVAFQAMRSGILGRFGPEELPPIANVFDRPPFEPPSNDGVRVVDTTIFGSPARALLRGDSALARGSLVPYPPFDPAVREEYLLLRPGEAGPTRVSIAIPARATGFLGDATVVGRGSESPAASRLSLTIAVDGETVLPLEPPPHPAAKSFSVPLEGKRELELVVSGANPPANGAWIHVAGAHFAWKP